MCGMGNRKGETIPTKSVNKLSSQEM